VLKSIGTRSARDVTNNSKPSTWRLNETLSNQNHRQLLRHKSSGLRSNLSLCQFASRLHLSLISNTYLWKHSLELRKILSQRRQTTKVSFQVLIFPLRRWMRRPSRRKKLFLRLQRKYRKVIRRIRSQQKRVRHVHLAGQIHLALKSQRWRKSRLQDQQVLYLSSKCFRKLSSELAKTSSLMTSESATQVRFQMTNSLSTDKLKTIAIGGGHRWCQFSLQKRSANSIMNLSFRSLRTEEAGITNVWSAMLSATSKLSLTRVTTLLTGRWIYTSKSLRLPFCSCGTPCTKTERPSASINSQSTRARIIWKATCTKWRRVSQTSPW